MKRIVYFLIAIITTLFARAQSDGSSYYGTGLVDGGALSVSDLDISRPHMPGHYVLRTNYHTGLSFSAHSYYGGIRFYNQGYLPTISNPYDSTAGATMVMSIMDGNVGIGMTNPPFKFSTKLSVDNNFYLRNATDWGDGRMNGVAIDARNDVENASVPLLLRASKFEFYEGNVGIGTTNPQAKLDVNGDICVGYNTGNTSTVQKAFATGHASGNVPSAFSTGLVDGGGLVGMTINNFRDGSWNSQSIAFTTHHGGVSVGTRMAIDKDGNVGIGTTTPTERLSVKGKIRAQEVIVETAGWSDYVFADDYKLPSLADVEAQIKTNKHLPGVPSAQEVAERGVSVGDMQALLLAKIEELTLNQISLDKQVKAQAEEIASLKSKSIKP